MPPSLSKINNIDPIVLEKFLRELESTADQIEKLFEQVQESSVDLTVCKTELRLLCEEVRKLSSIVRGEGGPSLVTRMALMEARMVELEKDQQETKQNEKADRKSLVEIELADKTGKWKVYTILVTGIIGIIGSIVTLIAQSIK